jgi:hypothetical protein
MIFRKISPKNLAKSLAFLIRNTAELLKNLGLSISFEEKRQNFRRKLATFA